MHSSLPVLPEHRLVHKNTARIQLNHMPFSVMACCIAKSQCRVVVVEARVVTAGVVES